MTDTINGYELSTIIGWLNTDQTSAARLARNLYTGNQLVETKKYLDGAWGIEDWRARAYKPFCHNITQDIIDKSGLLFADGVPAISVAKPSGKVDARKSNDIFKFISYESLVEKFSHLDRHTRLLKSAGLVFGFDAEDNTIVMDVIHAGNSHIQYNFKAKPEILVRTISDARIEVTTVEKIYVIDTASHTPAVVSIEDNVFGIIPIAIFHDEFAPMVGGPYNRVDTGLVDFNLTLNKQFTELNYSLEWIQKPTLFISGSEGVPEGSIAGPNTIVLLEASSPGQNPSVEYKCPTVHVESVKAILDANIKQAASLYCVRIEDDNAVVTSGFSLVVKENKNMELRKRRQREFENGFKRAQTVIKTILAYVGFDLGDANLSITFPAPSLPINEMEQEQIWSIRIKEGRASIKDYLMAVQKLTSEEADKKIVELEASKQVHAQEPVQPIVGA